MSNTTTQNNMSNTTTQNKEILLNKIFLLLRNAEPAVLALIAGSLGSKIIPTLTIQQISNHLRHILLEHISALLVDRNIDRLLLITALLESMQDKGTEKTEKKETEETEKKETEETEKKETEETEEDVFDQAYVYRKDSNTNECDGAMESPSKKR